MNKILLVLGLFLLVGCSTKEYFYTNTTYYINETEVQIREVPKEVLKIEYQNITVPDELCHNQMKVLQTRLSYQQEIINNLVIQNSTNQAENLTILLNKCTAELKDMNSSFVKIKEAIKNG